MAERITAVDAIAERQRNVAEAAARRISPRPPGRGRLRSQRRKNGQLEGFLFPAIYDFRADTTSAQLADAQLEAFWRNWAQVDLRYARSKNLTPYDVLIIASMIERETRAPASARSSRP